MMDEVVGFVTWAVIFRQERISWSTWWWWFLDVAIVDDA